MGESVYLEGILAAQYARTETQPEKQLYRKEDVRQLVESARTSIPRIRNSFRVKTFLAMNMGCVEDVMNRCILPILSNYQEDLRRYKEEYEQKGDTTQFRQHREKVISQLLQGAEKQHSTLFHLAETAGRVKYLGRHYDIREHVKGILMDPQVYARCIDVVLPYFSR